MKIRHVVPIAALALLLAACGGESRGEETGTRNMAEARLNSCDLVSADEVGAIFGTDFEEGQLSEYGTRPDENYFSICIFSAANESATPTVSVMARPAPSVTDPAAALEAEIEEARSVMPDFELQPVAELGEGAAWNPDMGLMVLRPGLMVSVGGIGGGDMRDRLVELARMVLERVPGR